MVHLILEYACLFYIIMESLYKCYIQNLNSFKDVLVDFVRMIIPVTPV